MFVEDVHERVFFHKKLFNRENNFLILFTLVMRYPMKRFSGGYCTQIHFWKKVNFHSYRSGKEICKTCLKIGFHDFWSSWIHFWDYMLLLSRALRVPSGGQNRKTSNWFVKYIRRMIAPLISVLRCFRSYPSPTGPWGVDVYTFEYFTFPLPVDQCGGYNLKYWKTEITDSWNIIFDVFDANVCNLKNLMFQLSVNRSNKKSGEGVRPEGEIVFLFLMYLTYLFKVFRFWPPSSLFVRVFWRIKWFQKILM